MNNEEISLKYREFLETDQEFKPDEWQKEVLDYKGNITIRAGRQVGKSIIIAKKTAKLALTMPSTTTLMIAAAQRQSSLLFEKTLIELNKIHNWMIETAGGYQDNPKLSLRQNIERRRTFEHKNGLYAGLPTKTELRLKNGSRIYSLPAGKTGIYIKGYTVDFLIVDEAAFIPEMVYLAVTPMTAVSQKEKGLGWTILLSTPFGKGGYFYNSFTDKEFKQFHISSESCKRISKEFLLKERKRLTKLEYSQEYLGEFVEEFNQLFKTELLKKRMTFISWDFEKEHDKYKKYFLGVDIARFGEDETAFVISEVDYKNHVKVIYAETTEKQSMTSTVFKIMQLDDKFDFNKVFIDDAGVGGGYLDLLQEKIGKKKAVGLNNSKKTLSDGKGAKILKEDLYSNALVKMEKEPQEIEIISDLSLLKSLKNMTFEYTSDRSLRIYGPDSHLAEAFVRALWCLKEKGLRLFLS